MIASNPSSAHVGVEPVGNMGNLAFPIQLEIPPSRSETQPDLQILYNSGNQRHGSFLGQSWSLSLGYIERSTTSGVPSYTTNDEFQISLGKAQGKLVQIDTRPDTIEYRMTRERLFLIIYFIPSQNRWVAIDKKGTQYDFGRSSASQIADTPARTFRWALDRVYAPQFNHTTSYQYLLQNNQLYPQSINYFHGRIDFVYQDHPQPFRSYKTGFEIKTTQLLKEIKTFYRDTLSGTFEPAAIYGLRYKKYQCGVDELNNIICLSPYLESITRYNGTRTDSLSHSIRI
ncbi:MAG: hypothetical protein IPL49_08360 [Saprospirales bacterium]|nr:hypothetical protein [Saprospirales bacterium]